jgi:hypothetical protein
MKPADGVTISLSAARNDNFLLLDRDDCGHVRVWHSAGATNLPEDQITDIFISALPEAASASPRATTRSRLSSRSWGSPLRCGSAKPK